MIKESYYYYYYYYYYGKSTTAIRTVMTLLAASVDQGTESFQFSVRMRRATSSRNALTSSPVSAASDTCATISPVSAALYSSPSTLDHAKRN